MAAQRNREKVAVLGGGPAAITAAFELTATRDLCDRFEVTVYQPGWRLGGKCASGRNLESHGRIEEHGLHLWFGFYDNAFRVMRAAYEELHRPADHPLATLEDAFESCDELVLYDRQGDGWQAFPFTWPRNEQTPGGAYPLPDFWEIAARMCDWAAAQWEALSTEQLQPPRADGPSRRFTPGWLLDVTRGLGVGVGIDAERGGEHLLHLARHLTRTHQVLGKVSLPRLRLPGLAKIELATEASAAHLLAVLLTRFRDWMWEHVVRDRCEQDPHLRLLFTIFDTFASATAGVVADGVLEHGWEVINDRDLCEWLTAHGAKQVTVGLTPGQRSPLLRSIYDVAFAYPGGVIDDANAAAGTAMNDLLRLAFSYRGSLFYKMKAGMGDTVLTPFYEVLERRGVKFEFFHAVTDLRLSSDGSLVEEIDVVPQVELRQAPYDPLVSVERLQCWPSEPIWKQLREGKQLEERGVNFELDSNPLQREPVKLVRGTHFHAVVLGIPVGALPQICSQIAERHERFARMLDSAETVGTQAFQLWLTKSTPELGWVYSTSSVTGSYAEPISTWCDMSHLLAREGFSAPDRPRGIAYFCGVLDDRPGEDHADATVRVKENARAFLEGDLRTLWPRAGTKGRGGGIDWGILAAGQARGGPSRLAAQYWRANTTASERYVLTPAKSMADRLGADESGVANLVLAGDWTRNGVDGGCVEAAVTSGMQAARALIGHDRRFTGESPTWLTDRKAPHRGPAAEAGSPLVSVPRLPAYVEYGSRVSAPPPVLARQGRFLGLVLEGDETQIEALCQRMLNVPAAGAVEYMPLTRHVLVLAGSFGEVSSLAPGFEDWGSVKETHISMWVPLAAGHREGKRFVPSRLCLAVPYILVDNPLSYAGGREDYGYPKAMGRFSPSGGLGDLVQVQVFGGDFGRGNQARWTPLLELARMRPEGGTATRRGAATTATADADAAMWREAEEIVSHFVHVSGRVDAPRLALDIALEDIVKAILDKSARQVFLKQFRDAETAGDACYQAIVEAPVQVTEASWRPLLQDWQVMIHSLDSHPIASDLGIATQTTRLTFEVMMNMIIDPGVVVTG